MQGHVIGHRLQRDKSKAVYSNDTLCVMGAFIGLIILCVMFSYALVYLGS